MAYVTLGEASYTYVHTQTPPPHTPTASPRAHGLDMRHTAHAARLQSHCAPLAAEGRARRRALLTEQNSVLTGSWSRSLVCLQQMQLHLLAPRHMFLSRFVDVVQPHTNSTQGAQRSSANGTAD